MWAEYNTTSSVFVLSEFYSTKRQSHKTTTVKLRLESVNPPFTQSYDSSTIMPIKPRSEKVLDRDESGPIGV
jgi:hypothetical protein